MSIHGVGGGGAVYQAIQQRMQAKATQRNQAGTAAKFDPAGKAGKAVESVAQAVQQASDLDHSSDKMVIDLATGRDANIHTTMVELEKSDIALKYVVQLRDRALSVYSELMRAQV
ncbi:MAG: flagellar hook-basal body complex protein FliE [Proteobacteria bacterium]|nr:flagellar hook-basal body complex protein FliE [Pseudomonadota bacterium]